MPAPPGPSALISSAKNYVPLEDFTHATCPKCGNQEIADERKFFGVLNSRGLQILVGLMIFGFIVATIFSTFHK
jgi:hypothetical protein